MTEEAFALIGAPVAVLIGMALGWLAWWLAHRTWH